MINEQIYRLNRALSLIKEKPEEAVKKLRDLASKVNEIADKIESGINPYKAEGGMGDRVLMNVVRNGEVKQSIDTKGA